SVENSHYPRSAGTSSHFPVHSPAITRWIEAESVLQIDDEVMVEVAGINLHRRRILLSLRS
ncbi:hypothetical protein, partial [Streptomyces sp. NPDC005281]|uniref:hypothetical protein n=1 Tax=Streptomyces sp. NPDC005281 TaxID=3155712 RepID=UPI0033BC6021